MSNQSLQESQHRRSSHSKDGLISVTVRKESPNEKAGIRLDAGSSGRVRIANIAINGLFANSELEIGDIVLSINGKRLQKGEGPEELIEVISRAKQRVTMVVKKSKEDHIPTGKTKDISSKLRANNIKQEDRYYTGKSKFKEDGRLDFSAPRNERKKRVKSVTISANKEEQKTDSEIDESAGIDMVVQNKFLFVNNIEDDSIFHGTDLKVGDRILSINDCNFRGFADSGYAEKIIKKANHAVTIVVEKGVDGYTHTMSNYSRSSRGRRRRNQSTSVDDNSDTDSDSDSFCSHDKPAGELKRTRMKEMVVVASKAFSMQEPGVSFSEKKKRLVVDEIKSKSIFKDTSLEPGDIVLEINDIDFRHNPDMDIAWQTCKLTKETVTMLIWKPQSTFIEMEFDLDSSQTDLQWH